MTYAPQPRASVPAISRFFAVERVARWWAALDEAPSAAHFRGGGTAFLVFGATR